MLPKRKRLSRREFAALLKHGRRIQGTLLSAVFLASDTCKCGVVVSKKTAKRAVYRNRIRRRLYALVGEQHPTLSVHIAFFVKHQAAFATKDALRQDVTALLSELVRQR